MILSVALPTPRTSAEAHSTLDIFNTGECISATGLATSRDLDVWDWQGVVFAPEIAGWDCYCRRINSMIPYPGRFIAFYDGSASHTGNYEERTGVAVSSDLRQWESLSPSRPIFSSPHGSGSLRYLDVQIGDQEALLFYEFARTDGAHDLRLSRLGIEALSFNSQLSALQLSTVSDEP
ncbi:MAG: hypothetical protein DME25_03480 [Verrucomicrobia bacterium]|nr:MAG: hypothetical protein DME25_03480 [Verrucomicrobiota bacterium]